MPSRVSCTPLVVRTNSLTPTSSSSWRTCRLSGGWARRNRRAAFEKLRDSATRQRPAGDASPCGRRAGSRQLALQDVGLHLAPSGSRLKFVLVMNDMLRYAGSSTIVTTVNHSSLSSENRTKCSVKTVFSLYGTPFLRSHAGRSWVVTTLSGAHRCGPPLPRPGGGGAPPRAGEAAGGAAAPRAGAASGAATLPP